MRTTGTGVLMGVLLAMASSATWAVDTDAAIGGAIGGAVGAMVGSELGGRDGAIAGSAVGAAVGTAVATQDSQERSHSTIVVDTADHRGGPPAHAYNTPPGHVKNGKSGKWK